MCQNKDMDQSIAQFFSNPLPLIVPLILWSSFWKGWALWKAANNKHLSWFIVFLFVNLLGILEIAYIFKLNQYDLGSKELLGEINKIFKKKAE
jgi:hypothetical protein